MRKNIKKLILMFFFLSLTSSVFADPRVVVYRPYYPAPRVFVVGACYRQVRPVVRVWVPGYFEYRFGRRIWIGGYWVLR